VGTPHQVLRLRVGECCRGGTLHNESCDQLVDACDFQLALADSGHDVGRCLPHHNGAITVSISPRIGLLFENQRG
jgi:hypothetical protein